MNLTTDTYKVAPGKYLGAIAVSWLGRWWVILLIPLVFFIAGFADWRWAAVGLILLMLVYPVALTTALLSCALSPVVIRRAASSRLTVTNGVVTLYKAVEMEDGTVSFSVVEETHFVDMIYGKKMTKIITGTSDIDFILIPTHCIPKIL